MASSPLELELHLIWVLGIKLKFSATAMSSFFSFFLFLSFPFFLSFSFFRFIYLFYVYEYNVIVFRYQKRASDPIIGGCEPPYGCWELNSGHLEEQSVLLNNEPSLKLPGISSFKL